MVNPWLAKMAILWKLYTFTLHDMVGALLLLSLGRYLNQSCCISCNIIYVLREINNLNWSASGSKFINQCHLLSLKIEHKILDWGREASFSIKMYVYHAVLNASLKKALYFVKIFFFARIFITTRLIHWYNLLPLIKWHISNTLISYYIQYAKKLN